MQWVGNQAWEDVGERTNQVKYFLAIWDKYVLKFEADTFSIWDKYVGERTNQVKYFSSQAKTVETRWTKDILHFWPKSSSPQSASLLDKAAARLRAEVVAMQVCCREVLLFLAIQTLHIYIYLEVSCHKGLLQFFGIAKFAYLHICRFLVSTNNHKFI